jgi:hypothetical protein
MDVWVPVMDAWVGVLDTWVGVLDTWVGVLDTWVGVLDTWVGVLDTWVGVLDTWVPVMDTGTPVLDTWVGVGVDGRRSPSLGYTAKRRARSSPRPPRPRDVGSLRWTTYPCSNIRTDVGRRRPRMTPARARTSTRSAGTARG